jgi:hypothetical protein
MPKPILFAIKYYPYSCVATETTGMITCAPPPNFEPPRPPNFSLKKSTKPNWLYYGRHKLIMMIGHNNNLCRTIFIDVTNFRNTESEDRTRKSSDLWSSNRTRYRLQWLPHQNSVRISSPSYLSGPLQYLPLRSPSNYYGTYTNHDVSHNSVGLSPELLAYHIKVLEALLLSDVIKIHWSSALWYATQPSGRRGTFKHVCQSLMSRCVLCGRVGGRHFEQI